MLDPVTGGLLVRAVGAGGGAADSTYAMQTQQQATLESMDGKLPALVNGAIPITDVTADVLVSASLTTSGAVGAVGTGATKANAEGSYTVVIDITGTWVGTISFYQTIDQALYYPIKGGLTTGGGEVSSTTTNGEFVFNSGGFKEIWAVMTSYTSGTATVKLNSSIAQQGVSATVSGSSAVGTAPAKPPVSVSGVDGSGLKRHLLTDTTGILQTSIASLAGVSLATGDYLPITPSLPAILSYPSSQTFTGTGTSQFTIEAGATYCVTVTNAPASTAALVATIGFQWSQDGASWNNATCIPVSSLPGAGKANVNSATAAGLWMWEAPINAQYFRFNCSAFTSGNINVFLDPWVNGNTIQLPWTYTVTSGQTLVPFFDTNNIQQIVVRLSAVTTTVLTVQGTNDISGTDVFPIAGKDIGSTTSNSSATITAAGTFVFNPSGAKWARVQCTTTGTVLTVQGITAVLGAPLAASTANLNGVYVTTNNASVSIGQVAGTTALNGGIVGSLAIGGTTGGGVNTTGIQNFATTAQNPLTVAGIDSFNQVHRVLTDSIGQQSTLGSGEIVNSFSLSAAAATVAEGTNSKTMVVPPVDGVVELDFVRCATSCQVLLEVTYGQNLWEVIPAQRVDLTATTFGLNNQIISGTNTLSFLPTNQSKWRAKVAGALGVRVHQVVGTANETVGLFRFIPVSNNEHGSTSRSFALGAASLTESFGAASSGIVALAAGTRTLLNPLQGGAKLRITADGFVSTNSTGIVQLTPEGSLDLATASGGTWYTMPLANLTGGFYSSSFIQLTTADTAIFEADASPFKMVRLRESGVSTGQSVTFGSMKIAPLSKQQVLSGFGASTQASATTADVSFFATNPYRKLAIVQNETTVPLFVLTIPGTASTSNYNVQLASGDVLNLSSPGPIRGFFTATTGTARLTEQY
jgi:hypothetical protein